MAITLTKGLVQTPIVDPKTGMMTIPWIKYFASRDLKSPDINPADALVLEALLAVELPDLEGVINDAESLAFLQPGCCSDQSAQDAAVLAAIESGSAGSDDAVQGASSLATIGAIPKVTSPGTLGGSALSDDGTTVSSTEDIDTAGVYKVAGIQVVGPQLPAVTSPTVTGSNTGATAGAAYTAVEQGMLNALKAAMTLANSSTTSLKTAVDDVRARLSGTGITA